MHRCQLGIISSISLLALINASAATRYVDLNSASPTPPYTGWATAATTIQDAVDAAAAGDQILVTNGVYQTGGRVVVGDETNRVVVDKALDIVSVNGPQFSVINGSGLMRCVCLTNGASLNGMVLPGDRPAATWFEWGTSLDHVVALAGGYDYGMALQSAAPIQVSLRPQAIGNQLELIWAGGFLQSAAAVNGYHADFSGAVSPLTIPPADNQQFNRGRVQP